MAQPSVAPRARVRNPEKLYQRAKKKRPDAGNLAFRDLTMADYAVMRAQLDEMSQPKKGGRPRKYAAGVAEARIVTGPRTCKTCGTPVSARRHYCEQHSSERERELKAQQQQRYREAHRETYRAAQKRYKERRRARMQEAA